MNADKKIEVVITSRALVAENICTIELTSVDGQPLPPFTAGAHIDVFLPNGIVRQYSICNEPAECGHYEIAVLKEPSSRGGSKAVHEQLAIGMRLWIGAPRNTFQLVDGAPEYLLFAGGIGITPILSMAKYLARSGASFQLFYFARSAASMAFRERLRASQFSGQVHFHLDTGPECISIDEVLARGSRASYVYVCGPEGFIQAVRARAFAHGWSEDRVRQEHFSPPEGLLRGVGEFVVRLQKSGRDVKVAPTTTIVSALAAAGVDVPTSCQQGVCGTCLTEVLGGEPDHRDLYLTDEEKLRNDQILPCCSRSKSDVLVLNL